MAKHIKNDNPPTLQDIADIAGCSRSTASLSIRGSKRISEGKRRQIREIANKIGYIPNLAARSMRFAKSGIIGIFTSNLKDAVRTELAGSLIANLHSAGYHPILGHSPNSSSTEWHEDSWIKSFQALKADAIIGISQTMITLPEWKQPIPFIFVGCTPDEELKCDYIALDRTMAASMAVAHLQSKGHKNILVAHSDGDEPFWNDPTFDSPPQGQSFGISCFNMIKERNLNRDHFIIKPYESIDLQLDNLLAKLFKQKSKNSAMIFTDSLVAIKFMEKLIAIGIDIPKDLAILSYDYFPLADNLKVPLTTIEQPIELMTTEAVKVAKQRIENPDTPYMHKVLPHRLVPKASTA